MQVYAVCASFDARSRVIKVFMDKNKAASFAVEQCELAQHVFGKPKLVLNKKCANTMGYYMCWTNGTGTVWVLEVPYDNSSSLESTRSHYDGYC